MIQDLRRKVVHLQNDSLPRNEEKLKTSNRVNKTISDAELRVSAGKKDDVNIYLPQSSKYNGIQ